jgi:hypothetical protein
LQLLNKNILSIRNKITTDFFIFKIIIFYKTNKGR